MENTDKDSMEIIKESKELLDIGAITQEEFDNIKEKYIDQIIEPVDEIKTQEEYNLTSNHLQILIELYHLIRVDQNLDDAVKKSLMNKKIETREDLTKLAQNFTTEVKKAMKT